MNVGESNDIAALLSWITDRPRATGAVASTAEALEAAERLAERAYQTQMAGVRAEDVRRLWPVRDESAHAELVKLRGKADRYIRRIEELVRDHRRVKAVADVTTTQRDRFKAERDDLRDERAALAAQVKRVRELHYPVAVSAGDPDNDDDLTTACAFCAVVYPCITVRALDGEPKGQATE